MTYTDLIYFVVGEALLLICALSWYTANRERKARAIFLSMLMFFTTAWIWFGSYFLFGLTFSTMMNMVYGVLGFSLLFLFPLGRTSILKYGEVERFDERDAMFARDEYLEGTAKHEQYYEIHPENREIDDKFRAMPAIGKPGGRYYDRLRSGYVDSLFAIQDKLKHEVDGEVSADKVEAEEREMAKHIKDVCKHLGAVDTGIAKLNPGFVYSHVGRGPAEWGSEITNSHKNVVVFTVEMDYDKVEEAPDIGITEETALQYLNTQVISLALAKYIRDIGWSARAHVPGSDYQIILPAVAQEAGLGELGRLNYLISKDLGPRVRLGAVTTDLPLTYDKPIKLGVQDFCASCKKCAINCPSGSIPMGGKETIRGVEKWSFEPEKCFQYWKHIGTDCGICMRVCPYSHPDSLFHDLIRAGIKRSPFARFVSRIGDDIFYGRKVKFPRFKESD